MKIVTKLVSFLEIIAILGFIIFEKSVWAVALKTFNYVKTLSIFTKVNDKLADVSEKVVLSIFGGIFLLSKFMSLAAVTLIGSGHFTAGIVVYILTFPVGAASIWLLEMQKDKLMSFGWFKVSYEFLMRMLEKLKQSAPYSRVKTLTASTKEWLVNYKANLLDIKNNRASYMEKLKNKYNTMSGAWKVAFNDYKESRKKSKGTNSERQADEV